MAIYKGREVTITNYVQPGQTVPDTIQVVDKDGQSFSPNVSEVKYTEAEKKELKNYHSNKFDQVKTISDAELKKFRDENSADAIEKKQADEAKKATKPTPVSIVPTNTVVAPTPKPVVVK